MKKKLVLSLIVGIAISAVTLWLAFRNVPFNELAAYLRSVDYFWMLPSAVLVLLSFVFRVFRWQVILGASYDIPFWRAFHPLMIGFTLNCILPGRVGEVARPIILQKSDSVPFSAGIATVAAERLFDLGMLIVLFALVLTTVKIDPSLDISFGAYHLNRETLDIIARNMLNLCVIVIAGIAVISFSAGQRLIVSIINKIPALFFFAGSEFKTFIAKKVSAPLISIVKNIALGFSLVKYPKRLFLCIIYSAGIWITQVLSYQVLSFGCPGIDLSISQMTAVMVIICFFIALPSAPGFWGLWEAGAVFAMALFGISAKDAAGYALANHVLQMFPVIFVGLISAAKTGVNISRQWSLESGSGQ